MIHEQSEQEIREAKYYNIYVYNKPGASEVMKNEERRDGIVVYAMKMRIWDWRHVIIIITIMEFWLQA